MFRRQTRNQRVKKFTSNNFVYFKARKVASSPAGFITAGLTTSILAKRASRNLTKPLFCIITEAGARSFFVLARDLSARIDISHMLRAAPAAIWPSPSARIPDYNAASLPRFIIGSPIPTRSSSAGAETRATHSSWQLQVCLGAAEMHKCIYRYKCSARRREVPLERIAIGSIFRGENAGDQIPPIFTLLVQILLLEETLFY